MSQQNKQNTPVEQSPSKLESFRLDFEYDKTLREIRSITRKRSML